MKMLPFLLLVNITNNYINFIFNNIIILEDKKCKGAYNDS